MKPAHLLVSFVTLAMAAAPRLALADPAWSVVDIRPGEPTATDRHPPPTVRVRVIGDAAPAGEDVARWTLRQVDARLRPVAPTRVIPYHRSSEPLAIVVLVEGHEYYLGNDSYFEEGGEVIGGGRSEGVHLAVRSALDLGCDPGDDHPAALACAGPPGSKLGLVVYGATADVRAPMEDLRAVEGGKLGDQQLQRGQLRRELAVGLQAALELLRKTPASRRLLIVVSDGFEASGSAAIAGLKRQLKDASIGVVAVHYELETRFIGDTPETRKRSGEDMKHLGGGAGSAYVRVHNLRDLPGKLTSTVLGVTDDRFWLELPGRVDHPRTGVRAGFTWDGREHPLELLLDEEPVGAAQGVVLLPVWGQPRASQPWWPWLAGGAGLLLLAGVLLFRRARSPAPAVVAQPLAPATTGGGHRVIKPEVAPGEGRATIAVDLDGVPLVGWLVAINGPHQSRTFKLGPGTTKLGSERGRADHVFDDTFMSGEHAHVKMSPGGFVLVDNLSANGCYVNQARVDRHELLDNDLIRLGKTDFKFKTTRT